MKCGDGVVVFLKLRIEIADEIVGVGFIGKNLGDMLEGCDAIGEIGHIFVDEAEVVQGVGVARQLPGGGEKGVAGGFAFLLIEQGDAEIETGDGKFRVSLQSLLKKLLRIGGALRKSSDTSASLSVSPRSRSSPVSASALRNGS